jgi:BolA protein
MAGLWGCDVKKQAKLSLDFAKASARTRFMARKDAIAEKLMRAFAPADLRVVDDSARHAGHAGASPAGETHFDVYIVSGHFTGLSRVERQRRIHAELAEEFRQGLHALTLKALTPDEAASRAE